MTPSKFLSELALLKSDAAASHALESTNDDVASMAAVFSQLSGAGGKLGGLAHSLVGGKAGGTALLAYSAAFPPTVGANGHATAAPGTLVLSPAMRVGTSAIRLTYLDVVINKGAAVGGPDVRAVDPRAAVPGWKLVANAATVATMSFRYNGWAYPITATGACA